MCMYCRLASINFACLTYRARLFVVGEVLLKRCSSDHRMALFHSLGRISRLKLAEWVGQYV